MVKRLPSCAQPSPFFLPGLREEISILIVICPIYFSFQRKVGSGFRPILSQRERRDSARRAPPFGGGRPRAMLAPDASVGKAEKNSDFAVCGKISIHLTWVLKCYFADSLFFDSCITVFELCDGVTANWSAFKTHINAEEKSRLVYAEASNSHPSLIRNRQCFHALL